MMSNDRTDSSDRRDDGFRVADAAVDRAVSELMFHVQNGHDQRRFPRWPVAAAVALLAGMLATLGDGFKPDPCVTFACQLEALTEDELSIMMEVMDEENPLILGDEPWPTLY